MSVSRRGFLKGASVAPLAWGIGSPVPHLLRRALADSEKKVDGPILVVVQLSGGNDGLNTVVPFQDKRYRQARPKLAIPAADVLKLSEGLGLHPALRGFADLWEREQLAIVQGVGYPQPNRSHFESMDIWHTCLRKSDPRTDGWLGRALDQWSATRTASDPLALHLGAEKQPLALVSRQVRVPSIRSLDQFRLNAGEEREAISQLVKAQRADDEDDLLSFVQTSTASAIDVSGRFGKLRDGGAKPHDYPATALGAKLSTVAQLIAASLETRIYYVELDGFDTHAQQPAAHSSLLKQLGDAVQALNRHMADLGLGDRVLTLCFSEFGRRVAENASDGTDHGAAAPVFLVGNRVAPGLIGTHPRLDDLDQGDLKFHTDFRQVYASILDSWLGVSSEKVLGGKFDALPAIRAI